MLAESGLDGSCFDANVTARNVEVNLYGHEQGVELYPEQTVVEVEIGYRNRIVGQ